MQMIKPIIIDDEYIMGISGCEVDIEKSYKKQLSPYYAAARLWVDGVIDPQETRKIISMGIEAANHKPITERYNVGVIQT